jgi:hypothetical protein
LIVFVPAGAQRRSACDEPRIQAAIIAGMISKTASLLVAALLTLHAPPAAAYIDPNVGGLLFQLLAPVFVVIIAFWNRLKSVVSHLLKKMRAAVFRR